MRRVFCLSVLVFCFCVVVFAADKVARITGKVVDKNGEPLKGIPVGVIRASKVQKDSKVVEPELTVRTGKDGSFSIRVDKRYEGIDAVYVFTLSKTHKNQIHDGVEFEGTAPGPSDFENPNVKRLDLRKGDVSVEFRLESRIRAKMSVMVEMRDGIRLSTDVYLPVEGGKYPAILVRTPYGKDTVGLADIVAEGYALVVQDMRGLHGSEGEALPFVACGWGQLQDGYDTVEWIAKQDWSNGVVGTFGGSALGITQNMMAGAVPPHLKAQWILNAANSLYHHAAYVGGAYRKEQIEEWTKRAGYPPQANENIRAHPCYDDFWRQLDSSTRANKINVPSVHIGGWFDTFCQGTIDSFLTRQENGAEGAKGRQVLVMGPWTHGGERDRLGEFQMPENGRTPPYVNMKEWFDYHLKGTKNNAERYPPVIYYVLGAFGEKDAPGNLWRTADKWPPSNSTPTPLYLRKDNKLSFEAPAEDSASATYDYDPKDPSPTIGGRNLTIEKGPYDQRRVESRKDIILFTSDVLEKPIEVTGQIKMVLYASSSAVDTDFVVRLCDVYPDGRSVLIADGIVRCRYRNSFEKPELMEPGKIYKFEIDLWATSIVFNKGHRIRVSVTSSNYPRWDANPNTGKNSWEETSPVVARNTVYFEKARASHILLPIMREDVQKKPTDEPHKDTPKEEQKSE
jgi:predicted acyl esterase